MLASEGILKSALVLLAGLAQSSGQKPLQTDLQTLPHFFSGSKVPPSFPPLPSFLLPVSRLFFFPSPWR